MMTSSNEKFENLYAEIESTNAANVLVKQFDSLTYEYINENYLNEFIQDLYESCMNEDDDDDEKNKTTTAAAAGATGNKKKSNGSRIVNDSDIIESKKINVKIFGGTGGTDDTENDRSTFIICHIDRSRWIDKSKNAKK